MHHLLQRTINKSVSITGIGLHRGKMVRLTLRPAPADSGITFIRTDLAGKPEIKASYQNVICTQRNTTLGLNGASISTVEHLLSAVSGLGIDNLRVELDGVEIPIMDGSSGPFVLLLKSVGLKEQDKNRKFFFIHKPVSFTEDDKYISVNPASNFSIDCSITFDHPKLADQNIWFEMSKSVFENEISQARTYGFLHEIEHLKANGLALGGSLDNAVVIDHFQVLNEGGLRYEDEFVRHKILDFMGDISLLGAPLIGQVSTHKTGHTLNHAFINRLMSTPDAWTLVEPGAHFFDEPDQGKMIQVTA